MLRWTVFFLIVALILALFGYGAIATGAAFLAKPLFFVFIGLFFLSLVYGASPKNQR